MDLINIAPNQRVDYADFSFMAQTQPLGLVGDINNAFVFSANSPSKLQILTGFKPTAAAGSGGAYTVTIQNGSAILAWRQGATVQSGVLMTQDALPVSQTLDVSALVPRSGTASFGIYIRFNYTAGLAASRTFWNSDNAGFEYSQTTPTRLQAQWEARVESSSPGAEYLQIGTVTLPSMAVTDTRTFFFEGSTNNGVAAANTWGKANDRNAADRATYGIHDLHTFVRAMKTCIEDVKGPGLRRWYDQGIGGINVGFTTNSAVEPGASPFAPQDTRIALGDAAFYLRGRTAADPQNAYFVFNKNLTSGQYDGLNHTLANNTVRWMTQGGYPILVMNHAYGTFGVGNLSDIDLMVSPGRSLSEFVTSASGQSALRLGARAYNSAVPCGIDTLLNIVAPDQTGNLAGVEFSTGGVQGTEHLLFQLGKSATNTFRLSDILNNLAVFDYSYVSKTWSMSTSNYNFSLLNMNFVDSSRNQSVLNYNTSNGILSAPVALSGTTATFSTSLSAAALTISGSTTLSGTLNVGGSTTLSSTLNVTGAFTGGNSGSFAGALSSGALSTTNNISCGGSLNVFSNLMINGFVCVLQDRFVLPTVAPNANGSPSGCPTMSPGPVAGTLAYTSDGNFWGYSKNVWVRLN